MKNPYEILGVSSDASESQIRSAYREKAAALGASQYIGREMPDDIAREMKELDEAYDTVINLRRLQGNARRNYYSAEKSSDRYSYLYDEIGRLLDDGDFYGADRKLDDIPFADRGALWHYLKGRSLLGMNKPDEAEPHFSEATRIDPDDPDFSEAYRDIRSRRSFSRSDTEDDSWKKALKYLGWISAALYVIRLLRRFF